MLRKLGWLLSLCLLLPGLASARFEVGAGMEYYTAQAYARDAQGEYFQSLFQSTLATARAAYLWGPLTARLSGGWSDWNVFGTWQGTYLAATSFDELASFARQQFATAEANCRFWDGLSLGIRYEDRLFLHYYPEGSLLWTQYRLRSCDLTLAYAAVETSWLRLNLEAAYSPANWLEAYQTTALETVVPGSLVYDTSGTGSAWKGQAQLAYRDSAGWGLDIVYAVGWTRFPAPRDLSEITLRSGNLTGYLLLFF